MMVLKPVKKPQRHLSYTDRLTLEALLRNKVPKTRIAETLGCSLSTVYNELHRGQYVKIDARSWKDVWAYSADVAQQKIDYGRSESGPREKIGSRHDVVSQLAAWLSAGDSPAVCAERLRQSDYGLTLCTNTIYSYIRKGYIPGVTMATLPEGPRRTTKREKVTPRPRRATAGTSIEHRPPSIHTREEIGHWEMDCVIGKSAGLRQALLTLTERQTRYEIIIKLQRKDSKSVVRALDKMEKLFGPVAFRCVFKSITVDNGSEFSDAYGMEYSRSGDRRTKVYYCHPYCSSERGTNERHNRIIRRFLPKGKSLWGITQRDCDSIAHWMNNYPRKVLGWATPEELFSRQFTHSNQDNFPIWA